MSTSKIRRPIHRRLAKDRNVKEYGFAWRIPSRNSYQSKRDGPASGAIAPSAEIELAKFFLDELFISTRPQRSMCSPVHA